MGKVKLLVSSNFSFSHSVFKRLVLQTRKNKGLFVKGLMVYNELDTMSIKPFVKKGLNTFVKKIDSCQTAQFAQVAMGRNFSRFLNFFHVNGWFHLMIQSDVRRSDFMESESESLLTYPHVYRHIKIILQMSRYLIESLCVCVCVCVCVSLSLSLFLLPPSCSLVDL